MTFRTRLLLGILGLLLAAAAILLLSYALQPVPVESLRASLNPALFTPPLAAP